MNPPAIPTIDLRARLEQGTLELRGDGKAGGGLVLAFQSLAGLFVRDPGLHVQEWPFFSSARRGANIRSFLRVSRRPITTACEVTRPALSLLMDEGAAHAVDFAQGVPDGGTFVLNTARDPETCARHFGLSGRVVTVAGDSLGLEHLGHPIGNVSAYVAIAESIGGYARADVIDTFVGLLRKRRIPESVVDRNRRTLEASFEAIRSGTFDHGVDRAHEGTPFEGYGALPIGAQTPLRLSRTHRTANFAPSGFRLRFQDPADACTGCALCISHCPEGIIRYEPDPRRGVKVTGADVSRFCKLCQECVAVCPEQLFVAAAFEERWDDEGASPS